jgi:hypothetical protein
VAELDNFQARKTAFGNDTFVAGDDWRDGNHDDLVLAVALAAWLGGYAVMAQVDRMRFRLELAAHYEDELGEDWASMIG